MEIIAVSCRLGNSYFIKFYHRLKSLIFQLIILICFPADVENIVGYCHLMELKNG